MTLIVGWATESAAFLAADAAVTWTGDPNEAEEFPKTSVFSERHPVGTSKGGVTTYEGAWKIKPLPFGAIAVAGQMSISDRVSAQIARLCFGRGMPPLEALNQVVQDTNSGDISRIQLVLAHHDGTRPWIHSWNDGGSRRVEYQSGVCMLGSMGGSTEPVVVHAQGLLERIVRATSNEPTFGNAAFLACALGLLQRFSLLFRLIDKGIGGTFSGAWIDRSGVHLQPDIFYLIGHPTTGVVRAVSTFARNGCLLARSNEHFVIFCNSIFGESTEMMRQRLGDFRERIIPELLSSCQWDFVNIISGRPLAGLLTLEFQRSRQFPSNEPYVAAFQRTESGYAEFEIEFDAADLSELDKAILFYVPFNREAMLLTIHEDN
jgi:hypothetical protein